MGHGRTFPAAGALVAALAIGSSLPALAHDHPDRPRLDTNGDGSVDLAEIQAVHPDFTVDKFNAADANGDGLLSRDELRAAHKGARMAKLDTDGDGKLSLDELRQHRPGMTPEDFAKIDANGDGQLSREELKAAHHERRPHRGDKEAKPDAG